MESEHPRHFSLQQGLTKRKADKILRNNLHNMEVMKNRLKVLTSHADYNRYREQYRTQQIDRHHSIHQEAVRDRQQVDRVMNSRGDAHIKHARNEAMKAELKDRMSYALSQLREERASRGKQIKQRSMHFQSILSNKRQQDLKSRKERKHAVARMEDDIRDSITRYSKQKRQQLLSLKDTETSQLATLSTKVERQLQQMAQREQQLIEINSQSMSASRAVEAKYSQIYGQGNTVRLPSVNKSKQNSRTTLDD